MGTRMVRIDEDLYERIEARKRDGETFSETINRLVASPSLLDLVGILDEEDATEFEAAIEEADAAYDEDLEEVVEEFDRD